MLQKRISFSTVPSPWWHSPLFGIYLLAAVVYFAWRVDTTSHQLLWFAIPFLVVELYSALTTILHLALTRRLTLPDWMPPLENRTVDAFIPTYNESGDIVEMTALGALRIRGVRNVFILDDGARPEIRALANRIGARYVARDNNLHAKAGNMNHGLAHSDAEFVIFLDCDHVPQPDFIDRTLGFFADEALAFVQTPQAFYNFRSSIQFRKLSFRRLWNEQTMFYENIQPAKNQFNAAFFCGSGAMLRRAALESVGGFATGTATEDIHTSLRLHAHGWRSVFLNEVLAYGIAAEDFKEYHAQRVRWGAGSLGLLFRSMDSPIVRRGLSPMQRLCYLSSTNAYLYGGVIRLLYLVFPVILLVAAPFINDGGNPYVVSYVSAALPFFVLSIVVTYLYSRRTFHPLYSEQFNIANILACLMALKGIFKVQKKFQVSIKSKRTRENSFAFVFLVCMSAVMVAADVFLLAWWTMSMRDSGPGWPSTALVLSLFWNSYNLIFVLSLVTFLHRFNQRPALSYPFQPPSTRVHFSTGDLGRLRCASLQGAIVSSKAWLPEPDIGMAIETRNGPIWLSGKVTGRDRHRGVSWIRVEFDRGTAERRKALTHFFFDEVVLHAFAHDFAPRGNPTWRRTSLVSRISQLLRAGKEMPTARASSSVTVGNTEPSRPG